MKVTLNTMLILLLVSSCKPKVAVHDKDGNSYEINVREIELTSSGLEEKKDESIYESINLALKENSESALINYLFLCDTSNIDILRDFDVEHKVENIRIHLGKKAATLSPIPGSYKSSEGPYAQYRINDDSLGYLHSYNVEFELDEYYKVKDYKGVLRFSKIQENGVDKVTFKKEIFKGDKYLIEDRVNGEKWR